MRRAFVVVLVLVTVAVSSSAPCGAGGKRVVVRLRDGVTPAAISSSSSNSLAHCGPVSDDPESPLHSFHVFEQQPPDLQRRGTLATPQLDESLTDWHEWQRPIKVAKRGSPPPPQSERRAAWPTDALYGQQWHLRNLSAKGAWARGWLGSGVTIAVADDGVQSSHPDLSQNFCAEGSWDFNLQMPDPSPKDEGQDWHGTPCAGVATARDNTLCGLGVAPRARVSGLRVLGTPELDDAGYARVYSYKLDVNHVFTSSWGPKDDAQRIEGPGPLTRVAMLDAVNRGRGGKGTVYVWAAGNGRPRTDSCNYDGYANSRLTICVAAVGPDDKQASYSEECASNFVSAPSTAVEGVADPGVITTSVKDRGDAGRHCTSTFGQTSAVSPMVAGVVALMLQANPALTWRDVQHILTKSTRRNDPKNPDWVRNGAGIWHSHKYGFGVVEATAAVVLSEKWNTVPPLVSWRSSTFLVNQQVQDNTGVVVESRVLVTEQLVVEWVEVVFTAKTQSRGELNVVVTSPLGTRSTLATVHTDTNADYPGWVFTTCRCWGENSRGEWLLEVKDGRIGPLEKARVVSWSLGIHGTRMP